ncbi:hypothetical protein C1J01_45920 [Nonomuraea aridisoli]|uniref:Uncharacterized protein n=2 Tax=Nonomuraea aridisoli TaxID=2070368 RepID=A0A2W2CZW8_9ACTN|nr:hypothetical protein C1J01_45920 [Nonomuraea aridisoli]
MGGSPFGGAPYGMAPAPRNAGGPPPQQQEQPGPAPEGRKSRRARKQRAAELDTDTDTGFGIEPDAGFGGGTDTIASGDREASAPAPQSRIGWSPYDEGPRSRAPLWFAIGGVAVLGLFGGGLAMMFNADAPTPQGTTAVRQTAAPMPSVPPGKYGFAEDRKTDPEPITVKELFGTKKKFSVSDRGYEMTVTSKDKKCTDGALGDKLQKALKDAKCTQFVRASFRDKDGKVIGTVGVANLQSSKLAGKVAKSGNTENYVKPLAGKDSVTKFLGSGSGGAKISTYGHYAVLVWFQNKDGTKPDSKGSKRISEAIDDITKATVFKALDNRTLTGSPLT